MIIPGKRFFIRPIICRAGAPQSIPPQMNLGPRREGSFAVSPFPPPRYHTVSLVSHPNRSGLRSPVEAGRVSVCAHHSSALCQPQTPLPQSPSPPPTRQDQVSLPPPSSIPSLLCIALVRPHPLLCLCTVLRRLALCTAEVSHFFMASFVWLDRVKKGVHVFFSFFSLSFCTFFRGGGLFSFILSHCLLPPSLMSPCLSNSQIFTTF